VFGSCFLVQSTSNTEARARASPHRGASESEPLEHDAFIPARSGMLDSDWLTDALGRVFFSPRSWSSWPDLRSCQSFQRAI